MFIITEGHSQFRRAKIQSCLYIQVSKYLLSTGSSMYTHQGIQLSSPILCLPGQGTVERMTEEGHGVLGTVGGLPPIHSVSSSEASLPPTKSKGRCTCHGSLVSLPKASMTKKVS